MENRFYVNKYPILNAVPTKEGQWGALDVGTIFTITGISGPTFVLKPVKNIEGVMLMY